MEKEAWLTRKREQKKFSNEKLKEKKILQSWLIIDELTVN